MRDLGFSIYPDHSQTLNNVKKN